MYIAAYMKCLCADAKMLLIITTLTVQYTLFRVFFCENNDSLLIIFDAFIQPPHIVCNEYNEYIR